MYFLVGYPALYWAQCIASAALLTALLARRALNAGPMAPERYAWLPGILVAILLASSLYLLLGTGSFNQLWTGEMKPEFSSRQVGFAYEQNGNLTTTFFNPTYNAFQLREASAGLGIVGSLGVFSAAGLLLLHALGAREARAPIREPGRERRVPPWRESRRTLEGRGSSAILPPP